MKEEGYTVGDEHPSTSGSVGDVMLKYGRTVSVPLPEGWKEEKLRDEQQTFGRLDEIDPLVWGTGAATRDANVTPHRIAAEEDEYIRDTVPPMPEVDFKGILNVAHIGYAEGRKDDTGKLRFDLIPPEALEGLARVLTFGAGKYTPRNWEKGMAWGRVFGALMRHLWAWWRGEDKDPETGFSHLDHAACCIAFLQTYVVRKIGEDDRAK